MILKKILKDFERSDPKMKTMKSGRLPCARQQGRRGRRKRDGNVKICDLGGGVNPSNVTENSYICRVKSNIIFTK